MVNPFSVKTPETLKAEEIAKLFIDVFSDFPRLLDPEHTFLHGTRGTGKSMMLRYLEPKVQIAAKKVYAANQLDHYAIHMPIRRANYGLSELERLEGAAYWLLAEHFLTVHAVIHTLESLSDLANQSGMSKDIDFRSFCTEFLELITATGAQLAPEAPHKEGRFTLKNVKAMSQQIYNETIHYLRKLTFENKPYPYQKSLFGYSDFLLPFFEIVKKLDVTPNGPVYLMLDDADNLPERMQRVVNTWVSFRSTDTLCLKISTQQKYRTWRTIQGTLIESPHDFSEIDINTIYTSKNYSRYYNQVEKVVQKRLEVYEFNGTPLEFFPTNTKQEESMKEVASQIKEKWDSGERVSSRKKDDVARYTVSEFMKILAKRKKTNTFSYAGFRNMVDISSGVIRFFLEPASRMYSEVIATNSSIAQVSSIPYQIQDKVLESWSKEFMLNHFEGLRRTEMGATTITNNDDNSKANRLRNLLVAFGNGFQVKLLSNDAERRFLSFMPTQDLDNDVQEILDMAVEWGYLYRSSIARKEGIGRNTLYVINRRLVPFFRLDPSGYAAHLSVSPENLTLAMEDPNKFVRTRFGDKLVSSDENSSQLDLFTHSGEVD